MTVSAPKRDAKRRNGEIEMKENNRNIIEKQIYNGTKKIKIRIR